MTKNQFLTHHANLSYYRQTRVIKCNNMRAIIKLDENHDPLIIGRNTGRHGLNWEVYTCERDNVIYYVFYNIKRNSPCYIENKLMFINNKLIVYNEKYGYYFI